VGLVTDAVRDSGLVMGLYHSLFEWFNPLYLADAKNNGSTSVYVDEILQPQLRDIVNRYKPDVIWSDGDWEMSDTYWKSKEFLAWLYNDSPVRDTVVTNDRWGKNDMCHHGGYFTCSDGYNPGVLVPHKWENCLPIDSLSWGYARNNDISDYRSIAELLEQLVSTVACNGNLLLNVGPTSDGIIAPIFEERLLQIGTWLEINGEAIYKTKPWKTQNDTSSVWYTAPKSSSNTAYAIFVSWPSDGVVRLTKAVPQSSNMVAQLLGYSGNLSWKQNGNTLAIVLPDVTHMSEVLRDQSAGTIKLVGVQ
jgi:alpha-L-fucosidase